MSAIAFLVTVLVIVVVAVVIAKLLAKAGINGTVSMIIYGIAALIVLVLLLQFIGWAPGFDTRLD